MVFQTTTENMMSHTGATFQPTTRSLVLPEEYVLGPQDVIIGRGKKCLRNPGNRRFRSLVQASLAAYSNALTKVKKSEIIMDVLNQVRGSGEDSAVAGFVKIDSSSGRYVQVEEASCRIAIAQAFRDALHNTYKSSKKHKKMRRVEKRRSDSPALKKEEDFEPINRSIFDDTFVPTKIQEPTATADPSFQFPFLPAATQSFSSISNLMSLLDGGASNVVAPAPAVTPEPAFPSRMSQQKQNQQQQQNDTGDLFDSLYMAFGAKTVDPTSDPFEPTPLAESSARPMMNVGNSNFLFA